MAWRSRCAQDASDAALERAYALLIATRPTAINLKWALDEMMAAVRNRAREDRVAAAYRRAREIADEDVEINAAIGRHGLKLIEDIAATKKPGEPVNVLTHCNAGWLATVDWGTATSPIYQAHDKGLPIHVWVDETRPRNQGASLTAWELGHHGVAHTVIPDNTGGHLMQHGEVDIAIVGTDRVTAQGDVCNKIGTYLKALAAKRQQRAVLCGAALADDRLHGERRREGNPDRAARRRRSHHHDRPAPRTGASRACALCRTARPSRTTASTSRRRGWSPG